MAKSHGCADDRGRKQAEPKVPGIEDNIKRSESTQKHLAFDAEVEHTTALTKGLTDGCIQIWSCQADPRGKDANQNSDRKEV